MRNKSIDLERLASQLDISPSMHKYAVDRYTGIAKYLSGQGIKAEFYPQGSFRTGTVVRPIKNGIETDFDIDVICELAETKSMSEPSRVKNVIGDVLKDNETYKKKLLPEDSRCWTLEYAEVLEGIGFNLDVVPAVGEDMEKIQHLIQQKVSNTYAEQAVAITEKNNCEEYRWLASNPEGFGSWFDDINEKFLAAERHSKKEKIFNENRALFSAEDNIDDVPDYYIRSSLQRIIQLLKRHRDLYYSRLKNGKELRPASVIITSLTAKIASETTTTNIEELLSYVINGFEEYSSWLQEKRPNARFAGEVRAYIEKRNKKWWIPNPVDPEDNYADSWTDETAKAFFEWVNTVKGDLANNFPVNEEKYITGLQTSFGKEFVRKGLELSVATPTFKATSPISYPVKPWGAFND